MLRRSSHLACAQQYLKDVITHHFPINPLYFNLHEKDDCRSFLYAVEKYLDKLPHLSSLTTMEGMDKLQEYGFTPEFAVEVALKDQWQTVAYNSIMTRLFEPSTLLTEATWDDEATLSESNPVYCSVRDNKVKISLITEDQWDEGYQRVREWFPSPKDEIVLPIPDTGAPHDSSKESRTPLTLWHTAHEVMMSMEATHSRYLYHATWGGALSDNALRLQVEDDEEPLQTGFATVNYIPNVPADVKHSLKTKKFLGAGSGVYFTDCAALAAYSALCSNRQKVQLLCRKVAPIVVQPVPWMTSGLSDKRTVKPVPMYYHGKKPQEVVFKVKDAIDELINNTMEVFAFPQLTRATMAAHSSATGLAFEPRHQLPHAPFRWEPIELFPQAP
eukprot:TRINITY_DN53648_c0_g1_i1.p1 TRINITY_DN53648_c0_g1~~TRINITY_DN53648_c0_g1_i1.p1  ORF type:complete len:387 (-),score=16.68 TRINITY_DN53648_c0_g1_i1:206-1366(-)